jgi:Predicted membrane protein
MFCKNCGNELPTNALYCEKCGTKIERTVTDTKESTYLNIPGNLMTHTLKKWTDYLWIVIIPFNLLYFMTFKITQYPSEVDEWEHTNGSYWLDKTSAGIAIILTLGLGVFCWVLQSRNKNCKPLHKFATVICTIITVFVLNVFLAE